MMLEVARMLLLKRLETRVGIEPSAILKRRELLILKVPEVPAVQSSQSVSTNYPKIICRCFLAIGPEMAPPIIARWGSSLLSSCDISNLGVNCAKTFPELPSNQNLWCEMLITTFVSCRESKYLPKNNFDPELRGQEKRGQDASFSYNLGDRVSVYRDPGN